MFIYTLSLLQATLFSLGEVKICQVTENFLQMLNAEVLKLA